MIVMAVNKVVFGDTVLVDLTDATVTPETLLSGVTAVNAAGEKIVGTFDPWPVGAVYISVSDTSPSTLFGGTWEEITDVFVLAYGDYAWKRVA